MGKLPRLGDYLTSADVKDGDILEIIEEPKLRTADETGFDRDVWAIQVKLPNKTNKPWTLNKTTYNECWDAFGDEGKNWIGKKLLITTETRKVKGQKKTIIYGEPIPETETEQTELQQTPTAPIVKNDLVQKINALSPEYKQELLRILQAQEQKA